MARFRLSLLGAWAVFVIVAGLAALAAAGEWANWTYAGRLARIEGIDRMIGERLGEKVERLREISEERKERLSRLRSAVARMRLNLDESQATDQTVIVSTSENRLTVRRQGHVIFEAVCSTGKGTSLLIEGRTIVFDTPTGRFRIQSKEENPVWVPPDWHFVEEARKKNLEVVRLRAGEAIDVETGNPVPVETREGAWSWLRGPDRPRGRLLKVRQDSVVEVAPDGAERELPPGELIRAGKAIVVPPRGSRQRRFGKILGHYRLNIGSGYGIHGTLATRELGRSASHGCVRLSDADIERLYKMVKVGDQVIIY